MLVWEEDMVKALRKERESLREENARLRDLLDGVLFEAGLQAHSIGCAYRLMRVRVSRGTVGPCRGCAAEAVLAAAKGGE